jgi:selenide,water dikinase
MGGVPKTAMNLVAFPLKDMDLSVLREIIRGGLDKMREAGVVLVGGHSVEDKELKYGLSVTGFIHPDRVLIKKNLQVGDRLILTKPLGTGIINTAIKGALASKEITDTVTRLMAALNRDAAEILGDYPVHACTDITGFGFLGHVAEMVVDSGTGIHIQANCVPILPQTLNYAEMGLVPAGAYKNREFFERHVDIAPGVDHLIQDILFDPQTSGGLLISVQGNRAEYLLQKLKQKGVRDAAIVGQVLPEPKERIIVDSSDSL